MAATDPSPRRRVPVRLCDVPVEVRVHIAREESRHAPTQSERDRLMDAAYDPSDQVFYVTDDAIPRRAA